MSPIRCDRAWLARSSLPLIRFFLSPIERKQKKIVLFECYLQLEYLYYDFIDLSSFEKKVIGVHVKKMKKIKQRVDLKIKRKKSDLYTMPFFSHFVSALREV